MRAEESGMSRWNLRRPTRALAAVATTLVLVVTGAMTQAPASAGRNDIEDQIRTEVLSHVNAERAESGMPALSFGNSTGAQNNAEENAAAVRLRHSTRGVNYGAPYYAEAVAYASRSGQLVNALMKSDSHRPILLSRGASIAGIGVSCASNGYVFLTFQVDGDARHAPAANPVVTPSSAGSSCSSTVTRTYVPDSAEGTVYRLYRAYFLREPDRSGFDYWIGQYRQGYPLSAVSNDFTRSSEFTLRYGGAVTNDRFVDLVYENVLGRQPDSGGRAYWVEQMDRYGMARGELMIYFSDSAEFRHNTRFGTPPGYQR